MTKQGFEEYLYAVYSDKTGTAKSYITAISIVDEMFRLDDVFGLSGCSVSCISDSNLLGRIASFICKQQTRFIKGEDSIFRNINPRQRSYPGKRFVSAAIKQLLKYYQYTRCENDATCIVHNNANGCSVSKELIKTFDLEKKGRDIQAEVKVRLGQNYFRKMVLNNYNWTCCVTGLNIPQILRASHIVAWAESESHRMNPENGLCLSATYDSAFDRHLISFDEDYKMIVSKDIKEYYTNEVVRRYFADFEGKQIFLPIKFKPDKKLLAKHRELMLS